MNAASGSMSGGGFGIPLFDVTQSGGIPNALVANQSGGNAGGLTLSKFWSNTTGMRQGPHEGDGSGVAPRTPERSTPPRPFSLGEPDPAWLMVREEPISPNAAMRAPINKVTQSNFPSVLDFPSYPQAYKQGFYPNAQFSVNSDLVRRVILACQRE